MFSSFSYRLNLIIRNLERRKAVGVGWSGVEGSYNKIIPVFVTYHSKLIISQATIRQVVIFSLREAYSCNLKYSFAKADVFLLYHNTFLLILQYKPVSIQAFCTNGGQTLEVARMC